MGCYRTTSQVLWVWTSVAFVTLQLPNALSKPVVLYAHSFVISTRLSAVTCCRLTSVPEFTQRALNTPNPCVSAPTAPVMSQSPLLMPECMLLCAALKELLPFTSSVQVRPVSLCFAQSHRHSSATTLHCSKPLHLQYLYGDYSSCCCIQVLFFVCTPWRHSMADGAIICRRGATLSSQGSDTGVSCLLLLQHEHHQTLRVVHSKLSCHFTCTAMDDCCSVISEASCQTYVGSCIPRVHATARAAEQRCELHR